MIFHNILHLEKGWSQSKINKKNVHQDEYFMYSGNFVSEVFKVIQRSFGIFAIISNLEKPRPYIV